MRLTPRSGDKNEDRQFFKGIPNCVQYVKRWPCGHEIWKGLIEVKWHTVQRFDGMLGRITRVTKPDLEVI
jgi:hypothetical protein